MNTRHKVYSVRGTWYVISFESLPSSQKVAVIIPTLQMTKLRFKEIGWLLSRSQSIL